MAASVILFRQPLRYVLDVVEDIEGRLHLDLLPALLLLVIVFTFHQYRKWALARAEAVASAADAAQARTQSRTLQQLMAFSRALANALDRATLQQVLWKHLPMFARDREFAVLVRQGDRWEVVVQDGAENRRSVDQLERLAARTLASGPSDEGDASMAGAEDICFPMLAAGAVVGVLIVRRTPTLAVEHQQVLGAAAAVIAIGVKNMQLFLDTRELSLRDELTGCFNRGHALHTLDAELRRARRTGGPLSILMFDVDHFKTVNDRFGHLRGDEVLGAIGAQLDRIVRTTDVRCRFGGDEFLIILPETPSLGAQQVAEMIREDLGNVRIGTEENRLAFTVSIGVASAVPGELDVKALIDRADEALYRAKIGRNRVSVAIPPSASDAQPGSAAGDVATPIAQAGKLAASFG